MNDNEGTKIVSEKSFFAAPHFFDGKLEIFRLKQMIMKELKLCLKKLFFAAPHFFDGKLEIFRLKQMIMKGLKLCLKNSLFRGPPVNVIIS